MNIGKRAAITSVAATISLVVFGCAPDAGNDVTEVVEAPDPTPKTQRWVSKMNITTDCGIESRSRSNGGFAGPVGVPVNGEMSETVAAQIAGGWGRTQVETDWERVSPGYVLVEPNALKESYLVNTDKEIVATFKGDHYPKYSQILPDGNWLVSVNARRVSPLGGGGETGCMEEYDSEGNLLWRIGMNDEFYMSHHAIVKLPNGNILAQVWEISDVDEAIALGRDPDMVPENGVFFFDGVVEVDPYAAEIVWEWSIRHHLIQDFDIAKSNFGVVEDHPELLDINIVPGGEASHDWTHGNSLDYNPETQQILLSIREMNEVFVIDHTTTPFEAARGTGGRYGKGGNFLYRWGNPQNYGAGTPDDRQFFLQHDARWIPEGLPGAGNIMVFNNGDPDVRPYTTITEFTPPMNADGTYAKEEGQAYGPAELAWEYNPEGDDRFYSSFISGSNRLPNGNTFINAGRIGHQREVTPEGDIVWEYAFRNETDAPHIMWRADKYPADYPGLADLVPSGE